MSTLIKNYEISAWELLDKKEKKLAIIGGTEMTTPAKAQDPNLIRNTNGTKTLKFSMYYEYFDEIDGGVKKNPFCNLLITGRRLKLKRNNKWYNFIITNIEENSEEKKISYTAQDTFITELSKIGFNVELSTELENNQGTIFELGNKILEKTDWTIDEKNSRVSPQFIEEVLIKMKTSANITPAERATLDYNNLLTLDRINLTVPKNKIIYGFYSTVLSKEPFFQFYYLENQKYEFDEDGILINCPLYSLDNYKYISDLPKNISSMEVSEYKGRRLIRTQKSSFDNVLNTYVKSYSDSKGNEIYGYLKTEYLTDDFVTNLVTNPNDFYSESGWYNYRDYSCVTVESYPSAEAALNLMNKGLSVEQISYLKLDIPVTNSYLFYNTGFSDNSTYIKSLYKGKKFKIKIKYGYLKGKSLNNAPKTMPYDKKTKKLNSGLNIALCSYVYNNNGYPVIKKVFFETDLYSNGNNCFKKDGGYWDCTCECEDSLSEQQLSNTLLGFFFSFDAKSNSIINSSNIDNYSFYIEDFQVFEYKDRIETDSEIGYDYYLPGEVLDGQARTKYYYFYKDQTYENIDEIEYLYQDYSEANYKKIYYDDYIQIRSIEQKESNCFNLIQSLCETFECWADFSVEQDSQGYMKKDKNGNFIKKITFKPFIGKETWNGFRNGINLKKIVRTINSDQIVTKTIVKENSNEFAPNGFCTIAYSKENPSGESFIYDFRYYENKGLMNAKVVKDELYNKSNGLYPQLKNMNNLINKEIEKRSAASLALIQADKEKQVQKALISELSTQLADLKKDFKTYTGYTYSNFLKLKEDTQKTKLELQGGSSTFVSILTNLTKLAQAKADYKKASDNYKKQYSNYRTASSEIKKLTRKKEKLISNFESKYSGYIREGSWVSEDYIDHDLYYVDAKTVAATSAMPQINYTIDVIDVSSLEEFFNYNVDIGDKTYIIDPEFFGYVYINNVKTPKKQQVIITEISEFLEKPQDNKITIQNYKTQFDDLFQRITATSQQLQLNEGAYNRASSSFTNEGLSSKQTQNSLNNSNFLLKNNTIDWNSDGLICTNTLDNRQFLKISNGSLFLTSDGGVTWNTAINGKGINASYIYTGQLDAGQINIVTELKKNENDDLEYALTLDKDGLSMYSYDEEKQTRVRLGKILTQDGSEEELYGLQLYNKDGKQTFKTDSNGDITMSGTIYASAGQFTGAVIAGSGRIGGWSIEENDLYHTVNGQIDAIISTSTNKSSYTVNNFSTDDWRLIFGINGDNGSFGVTASGNLYANGVDIKDGNISFGDIFKITTNGGKDSAISYGLNIDLDPENEDKAIVIESDDRVIGIREKLVDKNGIEKRDDNGNPIWTWKTILGDLTNATLGEKLLSDWGLTGYGLCTENGLFSGTIIAGAGEIAGFIIKDSCIYKTSNNSDDKVFDDNGNVNLEKFYGIYLGTDGRFKFGNENSYIAFSDKEDNEGNSNKVLEIKINEGGNNYSFTHDGLIIKNDSSINTVIDNNGMKINDRDQNLLLSADSEGVKAEDLSATTFLIIGNQCRFEKYTDSNNKTRMACYWTGG